MRNTTEIEPTERIVLGCGCGERIVLLGGLDDWVSEDRTSFECGSCGALVLLELRGDGGRTPPRAWPEDAQQEEPEPWVAPSDGSKDATARKLIRGLRAADGG
ncbi:MAG: hypothetical protein M3R38_37170 [Actinomycetota bacterium]|nr:hypothetical protein [Actinomycetota bacterium]